MSVEDFRTILPLICEKDTSLTPEKWTPGNPLLGHCVMIVLLVQDYLGLKGKILRASLIGTPFEYMGSHYKNEEEDYTAVQFGEDYPEDLEWEERSRDYLFENADTVERYEKIKDRLEAILGERQG